MLVEADLADQLREEELALVKSILATQERHVRRGWKKCPTIVSRGGDGVVQVPAPAVRDRQGSALDFLSEDVVAEAFSSLWGMRRGVILGIDQGMALETFMRAHQRLLEEFGEVEGRWVVCDTPSYKRVLEYNGSRRDGYCWIIRSIKGDKNG